MKVFGTFKEKQAEIDYSEVIATQLRDRNQVIADSAKREKMRKRFQADADAWQRIIDSPELLNLIDEFASYRQEYIERALFDQDGFDAMFK